MFSSLIVLAEISFELGLIGIDEFQERCLIADWLADSDNISTDPRADTELDAMDDVGREAYITQSETFHQLGGQDPTNPDRLEFQFSNWVFTKGDPDPYPSVPHGHWRAANNNWPKVNPYTGRAFKVKHQEDTHSRLSKFDLRSLWNDDKFRDFCRSHIIWYLEQFPYHEFPIPRHRVLRLPRWR